MCRNSLKLWSLRNNNPQQWTVVRQGHRYQTGWFPTLTHPLSPVQRPIPILPSSHKCTRSSSQLIVQELYSRPLNTLQQFEPWPYLLLQMHWTDFVAPVPAADWRPVKKTADENIIIHTVVNSSLQKRSKSKLI